MPKILVQTTSEVKFNRFQVRRTIQDFEVAMAKIERFDAVNQQFLAAVDAQILEVEDAMNTLACMLLDSIPELSYDDADFIIDVADQYLAQIEGDEEDKRKIVRRYATLIVSDIRAQIFEHVERKTQDIHTVQKDLILFRRFVKISVRTDVSVLTVPLPIRRTSANTCSPGIRRDTTQRTVSTAIRNVCSPSFWRKTRRLSAGSSLR